jgi:glycosyltransferase involved in cell wall biosynthesis
MGKRIFFTVTNDLSYDQRMIRICSSLASAGYDVTLVGRKMKNSIPLVRTPFIQKRLMCLFGKGKLFYVEYQLRLLFFLLFKKMDMVCAIDLDTILPCYLISVAKKIPRVYDAHELFCEMKEVVSRPAIYQVWKRIERFAVPKFKDGYTVNAIIAHELKKMYGVEYEVIRSVSTLRPFYRVPHEEKYILYQGAVNEGRSFETLIPAMHQVNARLIICGDGNFLPQARKLVNSYGLENKIIFKGKLAPSELNEFTRTAYIGVTLFENTGKSNYYSLANRFFDYLHAGVPQVCVNYPAYQEINNLHQVAVLVKNLQPESLAEAMNDLLDNETLHDLLVQNCLKARELYNWQQEEKKLLAFYQTITSQLG